MSAATQIPVFTLYGETEGFPDLVHCEPISARSAPLNWRIRPHRHAQMSQLFLIETGAVTAQLDGRQMSLAEGQFLYIPAQVVHAFKFLPDTGGRVVSFPSHVLSKPLLDVACVISGLVTPEISQLVNVLDIALSGGGPFRAEKLQGLSQALFACVHEAAHETGAPTSERSSRLERFRLLIHDNMEAGWSPGDYARALSVSTGHLSRLCRAATGMGAQAYIETEVMAEARRLLAFTQLPVAEVGYRTGFPDPSYFSKRFRAAQGVSPKDYRAQFVVSARGGAALA